MNPSSYLNHIIEIIVTDKTTPEGFVLFVIYRKELTREQVFNYMRNAKWDTGLIDKYEYKAEPVPLIQYYVPNNLHILEQVNL